MHTPEPVLARFLAPSSITIELRMSFSKSSFVGEIEQAGIVFGTTGYCDSLQM